MGTGRFPTAIATVNNVRAIRYVFDCLGVVVQDCIVDASSYFPLPPPLLYHPGVERMRGGVLSGRPISTSQLHPLPGFHVWPIKPHGL